MLTMAKRTYTLLQVIPGIQVSNAKETSLKLPTGGSYCINDAR